MVLKSRITFYSILFYSMRQLAKASLGCQKSVPACPKSCYGACYSLAVFVAQRWDFDHYFCMRSEIVFIQLNITQAGKSA